MARKGLKVATATINGKRKYFYAKTKREAILRAEAAKIKKSELPTVKQNALR